MIQLSAITSRYYLSYFALVLFVGGFVMIHTIKESFFTNLDRVLAEEKNEIHFSLRDKKLPNKIKFSEYVLIERISDVKVHPDRYSTTKGHDVLTNEPIEYRTLVTYFEQDAHIYKMSISQEVSSSLQRIYNNYLWNFLITLLVILIGSVIVNRYINKFVWSPFYGLLIQIKNFNLSGQGKVDFEETKIKEFKELNSNIDLLLQRVKSDYQIQKEFLENSSHEFKTPLTIITQRLDLLIQSENLRQSELEHIQVIYDAARKMKYLNQHLTILFKLENKHYHERQEINLWQCTLYHLDQFEIKSHEKGLTITQFCSMPDFIIQSDIYLFDILISNLISNAIKHNLLVNGQINIRFTNYKLEIINTGYISTRKKEEIFERFAKVADNTVSTGLGLSIVKKIVQFYNWEIDYQVFENLHCFTIDFNPDLVLAKENY